MAFQKQGNDMTKLSNEIRELNEISDKELDAIVGGESFDIEQTLNIGSQSTGAGAGKVTFNPFQVPHR
jgi:bacteriocin-like protein